MPLQWILYNFGQLYKPQKNNRRIQKKGYSSGK